MQPPVAVVQASLILDMLIKTCPAHEDALFIDAQIKYLSGDFVAATLILNKLLKISKEKGGSILSASSSLNSIEFIL